MGRGIHHHPARSACLSVRLHRAIQDDEKIDIAVSLGVSSCPRSEENELTKLVSIQGLESYAGIFKSRCHAL